MTSCSNKLNPSLLDAVAIFCWSLSAAYEGDIKSSTFEILDAPPFFKAELGWLDAEQRHFFTSLQAYFQTVHESVGSVGTYKKDFDEIYKQLEEKQTTAIKLCYAKKLDSQKTTDISKTIERNLNNLSENQERLGQFWKFLENERNNLRNVYIPQIRTIIREADATGKLAAEQNHRTFEKIAYNYNSPVHVGNSSK